MGGWLSMNFALHYPEKADRLILLAPAAALHRITPKFLMKVYPAILFPTEARIRKELDWFVNPDYRPDARTEILIRQFIVSGMNGVPVIRIVPSVFSDDELRKLTMPMLLMVGDREVIYDYRKVLKRAKKLMPHAIIEEVPGSGHAAAIERPDIVNEAIVRFLERA